MRDDDLHSIANYLCQVRDELEPILSGQIRRGHACKAKGDLTLEPGLRKTRLADARKISESMRPKLNRVINSLIELHRKSFE